MKWMAILAMVMTGCAGEVAPEVEEAALRVDAMLDSIGRPIGARAATIVQQNRKAETDFSLLARLSVGPHEIVEFYEPLPGLIMMSGAGAPDAETFAVREPVVGEDPADVWARLSGGAAMPTKLRGALSRAGQRSARVTTSKQPQQPRVPDVEPSHDEAADAAFAPQDGEYNHLTGDWCDSKYYTESVEGYGKLGNCQAGWYDRMTCWDHVTGSGSRSSDDATHHRSNACPYRGNIRMTIVADEDWIADGDFTILRNGYRWKIFSDAGNCVADPFNDCPYIRVGIDQADGDGYQYRFFVNEDEEI